MRNTLRTIGLCLALSSLLLAGLVAPVAPAQAQDAPLNVIATTTLIADVVAQVGGEAVQVTSLMPPGSDPHTYAPTAQDLVRLDEADVIFTNGMNFEVGLMPLLTEVGADKIAIISSCVDVQPVGEGLGHDHHDDNHDDEDEPHEDDHDEAHNDEHEEDNHHDDEMALEAGLMLDALDTRCADFASTVQAITGYEARPGALGQLYAIDCAPEADPACDPHVWTDVSSVMLWTLYARDVLSSLDPDRAEVYATNAAAYLDELAALAAEIDTLFAAIPHENRVFATNHETLGYLAARYDFEVVGTVLPGGSTAVEASAQNLVELIEVIEDTGAQAIFTDNTVSATVAQQIAEETGVPVVGLYSDSLSTADGPANTYLLYMHYNANQISTALSN